MLRQLLLVLCPLLAVTAGQAHAQDKPAESASAVKIFNGTNLDGWDGDPRLWSVRDGVIHGETTEDNKADGNTFLIWKGGRTANFELKLSFRCNATNNSGIQYRSRHITEGNPRNKWVVRGYQHELRNELMFPNVSGFIYDEGGKRGRIILVGEKASWEPSGKKVESSSFVDQEGWKKLFRLDDWNEVVIRAEGNHIQHFMNGQQIIDFHDNAPDLALLDGVLALQLHAGKPMWAEFRNIEIRELK